MARVLVSIAAVISMVFMGLIYATVSNGEGSPSATGRGTRGEAVASTAPTAHPSPAAVTIDEISRHPSAMPDSANYTQYDGGTWSKPVRADRSPHHHRPLSDQGRRGPGRRRHVPGVLDLRWNGPLGR